MQWTYSDGGRSEASFKGETGDCVTRAIAIATSQPYLTVYSALNALGKTERRGSQKRGKSNARTGVYRTAIRKYMEALGWRWTPTMFIGSGCKVHLRPEELPSGRIIVALSRHAAAVIDGVVFDTHDPSRDGTRCVYGYWQAA